MPQCWIPSWACKDRWNNFHLPYYISCMRYMHEVSAEQWVTNEYYFNHKDSPIRRLRTPHMFEWYRVFKRKKSTVLLKHIHISCCTLIYMFSAVAENLPFSQKHHSTTAPWYHTDSCFDFTVDFTVNHFKSATKRAVLLSLYTARNVI